MVRFAGPQRGRRKLRMVRRIRKMLRFETKSRSVRVITSSLARDRRIKKITRIELNTRLGRPDLQNAAAAGLVNGCRERQIVPGFVQHPIMVVTFAEPQLFVIETDT